MTRPFIALFALTALALPSCGDPAGPDVVPKPTRWLASLPAALDAPRYTLRVLDVENRLHPGLSVAFGGALNDQGQVVALVLGASAAAPLASGALIWDTETDMIEVIEIDGLESAPLINNAGQLAGRLRVPPGTNIEPFLWTPGVGLARPGFTGDVFGLNERGQIAGTSGAEAFRWDPVAGLSLLSLPSSAFPSFGSGIAEDGTVAGFSGADPVLWPEGSDAQVLTHSGLGSRATAINRRGEIVGTHFSQPGVSTGAYWASADAEQIALPCDPPSFEDCRAIDINDDGEILGSFGDDEADRPMIWLDGAAYDLMQLIDAEHVPPFFALGINERGQIGGLAMHVGSGGAIIQSPMILTPVPRSRAVPIDVKPGSDVNPINLDGDGVIPVAVLGSVELVPGDIDAESLSLNGLVVGRRGNGAPQCGAEDVNGDGFADLVCQFVDDPSRWTGPDDLAVLTGSLVDGTAIEGSDSIVLSP